MALFALACFALIVRCFGAAVLSRGTTLNGWQRAWLGAVIGCVVTEIVGLTFTLSSTLAGLFGASLGFGYSLIAGSTMPATPRRRDFTAA